MRRITAILLLVCTFLLAACSLSNPYELAMTEGEIENDEKYYIYYTDDLVVYVIGGVMTSTVNGESKLLELALYDGNLTVQDLLDSAEADADAGDIIRTEYPDGSVEYGYETFNLIRLNTYSGTRDIYFVPKSMNYNNVKN